MEFKKSLLGKIALHSFAGYSQSKGGVIKKIFHILGPEFGKGETKITKGNSEAFNTSLMERDEVQKRRGSDS